MVERRRQRWMDLALNLALLAFVLVAIGVAEGPLNVGAVALAVLIVAPLFWRRRWPVAALVACLAASAWYHALDYPHEAGIAPVVLALYTVAATGTRRRSVLIAAAISVLVVIVMWTGGVGGPSVALGVIGWIGLAVALGEVARSRSALLSTAEGRAVRAEQERAVEAALRQAEAAQREADTRRRVAEERLRIARDLHDVLAHSIAVINAQAAVASYLAPGQEPAGPPATGVLATAMATIAEASRTAMGELRATLDVLRDPTVTESGSASGYGERGPAPGLAQLDGLVESARRAGIDVEVEAVGRQRHLTPAVDLTAYRIAQEALTNVVRHAAGGTARVRVEYRHSSTRLTIVDGGGTSSGDPGDHAGYGIIGMTERAHAIGGQLTARPRASGGFEVIADLPDLPDERGDDRR
jgi:signal transduction histidine kinase